MTIVCATNEGLYATCSYGTPCHLTYDFKAKESDENFTTFQSVLDVESLTLQASQGIFQSYVCGTAAAVLKLLNAEQLGKLQQYGIRIANYKTTLPMKKGLSSSAAVCVLVAKCFSELLDLKLGVNELMDVAFRGEMLTPSKCGRMDQVSP